MNNIRGINGITAKSIIIYLLLYLSYKESLSIIYEIFFVRLNFIIQTCS